MTAMNRAIMLLAEQNTFMNPYLPSLNGRKRLTLSEGPPLSAACPVKQQASEKPLRHIKDMNLLPGVVL